MKLKDYQKASLATLRHFFDEARIMGPKAAYERLTAEPELAERLRGYAAGYKPIKSLPEVPYVCLRLPTGGGKTILAAHSIAIAQDAWVEKDFPLVLWLVPTNTIRIQTAEALKNPRHPYRRVLDEAFDGRVRVFDVGDFTQLTPHDLRSNLCVVVGTIQTLRVSNTDGRKVYSHHEMLEPHFSAVSPDAAGLERVDDGPNAGDVRFSFANLMHLHRPLVIMDEAHKAGSKLSQEVYERINPTALIEFTATPKGFNNILHTVSAQELKDEEMIKMPVVLDEADTWQVAVNSAILKRAELQEHADRDRDGYIRPIVLFQAQKKGEEVTVDVLKKHLIENENVDPHKIAVATGAQRELDGIDLFDPHCEIEYVITIEALKEGWDCSFAYVFCSVANIRSSTDAEQLLGRVLRMPYAKKRSSSALNKSYARLVSKHFADAANSLRDKLVDMGFEESEAEANIEPEQPELKDGLFGKRARSKPSLDFDIDASADEAKDISRVAPGKISVAPDEAGKARVKISGALTPQEKEALYAQTPERFHGAFREKIAAWEKENADEIPASHSQSFILSRLMAYVQDELVFGDTDVLMEYHDWSLADHPARLAPDEFNIVETTNTFEIDLDGNRLQISAGDSSDQLSLNVDVEDWTPQSLVQWLDHKVRDPWIGQAELLSWLTDVVTYLTRDRQIPLSQLMRCKFILARKLNDKIASFRQSERKKVYQASFLAPDSRVEVSKDEGIKFFDGMYDGVPKYRGGRYKFKRHFMGPDEVPVFDAKVENGEEEQCAFAIDSMSEIQYWTRNVSRHPNSFWLPTSTDKFYPDFVAITSDGRELVVEYKGKDRTAEESRDSREKLAIGEVWARAGGGNRVFVMATMESKNPQEIKHQISDALGR